MNATCNTETAIGFYSSHEWTTTAGLTRCGLPCHKYRTQCVAFHWSKLIKYWRLLYPAPTGQQHSILAQSETLIEKKKGVESGRWPHPPPCGGWDLCRVVMLLPVVPPTSLIPNLEQGKQQWWLWLCLSRTWSSTRLCLCGKPPKLQIQFRTIMRLWHEQVNNGQPEAINAHTLRNIITSGNPWGDKRHPTLETADNQAKAQTHSWEGSASLWFTNETCRW